MKRGMNKRGQITTFIIVAVIIVALVVLFFLLRGSLGKKIDFGKAETPEDFIQTCLKDTIKDNAETIGLQGGSMNPEFYYLYQDEKIQYLCYTPLNYDFCLIQVPDIKTRVESEIKNSIKDDVKDCFESLQRKYPGSQISGNGEFNVKLFPQKIVTLINYTFTFTKNDESHIINSFRVIVDNNLYEILIYVEDLIRWEQSIGNVPIQDFMDFYQWLKIEKIQVLDDTTIYILTHRNSKDKFRFAIRSMVKGFKSVSQT